MSNQDPVSYLTRALTIREKVLGPDHPFTATTLDNLASLYRDLGKHEEAKPLYQRALAIYVKVFGPDHPNTTRVREEYSKLLKVMGEEVEEVDQ